MASQNHLRLKNLVYGDIYQGGSSLADEPLRNLLGVGNMGGIRFRIDGKGRPMYVVLYSTGDQADWPDNFDPRNGKLTYFGDNRTPGRGLLEPPGNRLLDRLGQIDLQSSTGRIQFPPFLIFHLARGHAPRSVSFRGLAVPGDPGMSAGAWCTARYFDTEGGRYMNFELTLTVLDDRVIERSWLDQLATEYWLTDRCPENYRTWLDTGVYNPMIQR